MNRGVAYVLPGRDMLCHTAPGDEGSVKRTIRKEDEMRDIRRTWLLMVGPGAMVVASSFAPAAADAQVRGSGIRVSKDAYVPTTTTTTAESASGTVIDAPGFNAVDAEVYRNMTDANIMAHMVVGEIGRAHV